MKTVHGTIGAFLLLAGVAQVFSLWAPGALAAPPLIRSAPTTRPVARARPGTTTQPIARSTSRPDDKALRAQRAPLTLAQVMPGLALPEPKAVTEVELPDQAKELLDNANRLLESKQASLAIVQLDKALPYAPKSRQIHLALARAHIVSKDPAMAEWHLAKALSFGSDDPQAWYWRGIAQYDLRQEQTALKSLLLANLSTPPKPGSPVALLLPYALGRMLDREGYTTAALPLLEKALADSAPDKVSDAQKADPDIAKLLDKGRTQLAADIARLKIGAGQATAVIGDLEALVASGKADRGAMVTLLGAYAQAGQREKEVELLRKICAAAKPEEAAELARQVAQAITKLGEKGDTLLAVGLAREAVFGTKESPRNPTSADSVAVLVGAFISNTNSGNALEIQLFSDFIGKVPEADPAVYIQALKASALIPQFDGKFLEPAVKAYPQKQQVLAEVDRRLQKIDAEAAKAILASLPATGFAPDYIRGRLLVATSQPDQAVDSFKKSIAAKKDFAPAYVELMKIHLAAKDYAAVLAVRDAAVKAEVKSAAVHHLAGRAYLAKNKLREALAELRLAEQLDPQNADIVVDMADAYLADGDQASAMRWLRRTYEKDPKNLAVLIRLARLNEAMGEFDEALTYALKAQALDATNAEAGRIRGLSLLQQGKFREAIPILQVLAREHPEDARCQLALGQALVVAGRWNEAIKPLQRALALDQNLLPARRALADAFSKTGQIDEAVEQWKFLVDKLPGDIEVAGSLFAELVRRGDLDEAAKMLDKLTTGRDKFAQLLVDAARAADKLDLAVKVITRQIELTTEPAAKAEWQREMLRVLLGAGKRDEAMAAAKKFHDDDPKNLDTGSLYVALLVQGRKFDEAARVAKDIYDKIPDENKAADLYCDTLLAAKQYDKALALATERIKAAPQADRFTWKVTRISVLQAAKRRPEALKAAKDFYEENLKPPVLRAVLVYARILLWTKDYKTLLTVLDQADKDKDNFVAGPEDISPPADLLSEMRMDALARLGKLDEMKKVQDDLLAKKTTDEDRAEVWYQVAMVYAQINKADEARKALERALKLNPENVSAANDLGYQLADQGVDLDRAEKLIRLAASNHPEESAYLDSLAWLLYKKGKFTEAAELLGKVLEVEPEPDPVIFDHYGDVLYRLGERDKALAQWKASAAGRQDDPDREGGVEQSTLEKTQAKIKAVGENKSDVPVAPLGDGVTPPGALRT